MSRANVKRQRARHAAKKLERGDRVLMKDGRAGVLVIVHEGKAIVHSAAADKGGRYSVEPLGDLVRG